VGCTLTARCSSRVKLKFPPGLLTTLYADTRGLSLRRRLHSDVTAHAPGLAEEARRSSCFIMTRSTPPHPRGGGAGSSNRSTRMVAGEARARRKGKVAVFRLWPSCRNLSGRGIFSRLFPGNKAAEKWHFRCAEAQVRYNSRYGLKIQCVEYAVNPALEKAYAEKKEEMTRRLGSAGVNEKLLFHGTSLANSQAILRQNFSLDKVGAEGRDPTPRTCSATCTHVSENASTTGGRAKASLYTRKRLSHG